jgi:hypothetical protein
MNRGYDGNDIFFGNLNKSQFLDYLEGACNQMMIRLFAYCVMTLHITTITWFLKIPAVECRIF